MADDFVQQIARLLGRSPEETERTLHALADSIRDEVERTGEAEIEGLGVFRQDESGLAFEPAPSLERAVNHRYAGLLPLDSGPDAARRPPAPEAQPPEEPAEPDAAETEPAETDTIEAGTADPFDEPVIAPLDLQGEEEAPIRDLASDEPASTSPDLVGDEGEIDAFGEADEMEEFGAAEAETEEPEPGDREEFEPVQDHDLPEPSYAEATDTETDNAPEPEAESDDSLYGELIGEDAYLDAPDLPDTDAEADDAEIDALLEGVWMPSTAASDASHPLGPTPPEMMEEADFSVMGDEQPSEDAGEPEPPPATPVEEASEEAPEQAPEATPDGELDAPPPEPPQPEPTPEATAATPTPEPPAAEAAPPRAPGFAATATPTADAAPDRAARAPRERRSRAPIFGVLAALVLGTLAIVWFLNREPAVPPTDEPAAPIAADTARATPPAASEQDTAALAETMPEPEPEPEPPSADPLRSSAGIDPAQGGYAWVVASELSRAPAERRAAEFQAQGFRAGVVAEEAGGRTRYRVALGQFSSLDEANQHRPNLPAGVPADTWLLRF